MSTILRGYTSPGNILLLQSAELNIEIKVANVDRIDFVIDLTDHDFQYFNEQITDTIDFLFTNVSQLKDLILKIPDLTWQIGFGYNTKVATGDLAVEGLHFPLELLRLCSDLKIEILVSLYDAKLFDQS